MAQGKRILVTGMSGLIGGLAGRDLAQDYQVRALNRRLVAHDSEGFESFQADISDLDAIRPAFEGVDTVVHMAAYLGAEIDGHIAGNIRGVYFFSGLRPWRRAASMKSSNSSASQSLA